MISISKNQQKGGTGGVAQVLDRLSSKRETLHLNTSTTKRQQKRKTQPLGAFIPAKQGRIMNGSIL
jgi:hypothetical protein